MKINQQGQILRNRESRLRQGKLTGRYVREIVSVEERPIGVYNTSHDNDNEYNKDSFRFTKERKNGLWDE